MLTERQLIQMRGEAEYDEIGWWPTRAFLDVLDHIDAQAAELTALRERMAALMVAGERMAETLRLCDPDGERMGIHAPEDATVERLCRAHGYGAVIDSAARAYRRLDALGAFTAGPCVVTVQDALKGWSVALGGE